MNPINNTTAVRDNYESMSKNDRLLRFKPKQLIKGSEKKRHLAIKWLEQLFKIDNPGYYIASIQIRIDQFTRRLTFGNAQLPQIFRKFKKGKHRSNEIEKQLDRTYVRREM